MTPPPSEILYGVGSTLANLSASASNSLANMFGLHSTLSMSNTGTIITLTRPNQTTLPFNVDVSCSGIYSIIGFVIFAVFIAYITAGRLRNKFAILTLGIPLILGLNIIRITTILAIGYNFGEDLALQIFHAVGSTVLMFIGTLLLLAVTEKAFKKPKPTEPCPTCNPTPINPAQSFCLNCGKLLKYPKTKLNRTSLLKIIGIIIVTIMLLSIQAPVFALTQGPAQVMIQTPSGTQVNTSNSTLPFPEIDGYSLNYVYRDSQFEQTSGDDAALVYAYHTPNGTASTVWITLQISSSITSEHRWETCLISFPISHGQQSAVQQVDLRDVQIQSNPPITARYFAFEYKDTNQTQVVLYWFETATFNVNGTAETKYVMISIVMYPSSQDVSKAENQELPIALAINKYWQPIRTWSIVSLVISQNGLVLSNVAAAFLVLLILYTLYADKNQKRSLILSYKKLPEENQRLVKAMDNINDKRNITTQAIIIEFQRISPTPVSETFILDKIVQAENVGLIKKVLINKDDKPALIWKNQLPK